jgi:GNAT superfamily N-acetyltransferase
MPTRAELAENTGKYILPRPSYPVVVTDDYTYVAGPRDAWVLHARRPNVEWARAESRRRGVPEVVWWVGWNAPDGLAEALEQHGLVPDPVQPLLTGMTCAAEPPAAPQIAVRPVETVEQQLEAFEVDFAVWSVSASERAERLETAPAQFEEDLRSGVAHHWAAYDGLRPIGFARALDMEDGVALMGGAVLPEARGRGVYRALVHARWLHAAERGTPLLVVQAGPMSAPALDGLGFERHGEIHLFSDRL